jgi:hypothetical protein
MRILVRQRLHAASPERGRSAEILCRPGGCSPGAFFALTEHGLGPTGNPHYPLPWSEDGSGAYLVPPSETRALLAKAGFEAIDIEDTGTKYLAGYRKAIEKTEAGTLPPLGVHLLMGETALQKTRNAARNIEEGRTHPIQVICRKPG